MMTQQALSPITNHALQHILAHLIIVLRSQTDNLTTT